MGLWAYEPPKVDRRDFERTDAAPGSREKVEVMARRLCSGLPLWHPEDRRDREPT